MATQGIHGNLLEVTVVGCNKLKDTEWISRVQLAKALSQGFDDSTWPLQSSSGRHAGEVRLIIHYSNANKPAGSHGPAAFSHAAPQAFYSAPPPHPSVSYPPPATATPYPPVGGYPAPSPYPSYPPNSGTYPPSAYPPQATPYTQPYPQGYPPNPAYPPQPYGSQYPSGPPYPRTYPPPY